MSDSMFDEELPKNNGLYLRFEDGKPVTGVFRGKVEVFYGKWTDKKFQLLPKGTPGAKLRFCANFVSHEKPGGSRSVQILEGGASIYSQLQELEKGGYPLSQTWVRIKKTGSGLDTEYSVLPLPVNRLTTSEDAEIQGLTLITIQGGVKAKSDAPKTSQVPDVDSWEESADKYGDVTESMPF